MLSSARERYFALCDDALRWYKREGDANGEPHGQMVLAGARLEREAAQIVLVSSQGDRLRLNGEKLEEWADSIESAIQAASSGGAGSATADHRPNSSSGAGASLLHLGLSSIRLGSVRMPDMHAKIRAIVSQEKVRFQQDGFDLDLTHITPRIIAMGFPSTGFEGQYRNNAEQVRAFFERYYPQPRYRIFNLCEERVYTAHSFGGDAHPDCLRHYPFPDHNPPCLDMIHAICVDAAAWLNGDEQRVVAVHCKAGKGRTGLVVSSLLLHLGICSTAAEALGHFSQVRTNDGKGVTIPSQIRYVGWYAQLRAAMEQPEGYDLASVPLAPVVRIRKMIIRGIPDFDLTGANRDT